MAERPDQIEQHIASTRDQLGNNLHALEDKVKQAADWKTYYERNPMMMVGLVFGGGVMLAAALGGGRRDRDDTARPQQTPKSAGYLAENSPIFDTWQNVRAALIGFSGAKLRDFLDQALPGFSEHYDKAARANSNYSPASSYSQNREYEAPSHRM